MLPTAAETITPEPCQVDDLPSEPTQDAHRSFFDLFEDGAPRPATSVAIPAATPAETTSSVPGASRRQGGVRGSTPTDSASKSSMDAAASVRRGLLGRNTPFRTPYGMKPLVYSDWTATGRAVASIEVCKHTRHTAIRHVLGGCSGARRARQHDSRLFEALDGMVVQAIALWVILRQLQPLVPDITPCGGDRHRRVRKDAFGSAGRVIGPRPQGSLSCSPVCCVLFGYLRRDWSGAWIVL